MSKIVGNSPNQVPTNADLGSSAFLDQESFISAREPKIKEVLRRIEVGSGSVKEIFVYDTSQDSDGGAWRKRCQQTGWYNEELNTSDRGSRKDFPSIAVIIVTESLVTILDGDSQNLDMWMMFHVRSSWNSALLVGVGLLTCCHAKNGTMLIGQGGNAQGVISINFISDSSLCISSGYSFGGRDALSIAERNTSGHTFNSGSQNHGYQVWGSNSFNALKLAVSSNASINPDDGMPYPIIVGANAYAVQLYKFENNSMIYLADSSPSRPMASVDVLEDNVLAYNTNNGTVQEWPNALLYTSSSTVERKYNYTVSGGHSSNSSISAVLRRSGDSNRAVYGKTTREKYTDGKEGVSYLYDGDQKTWTEGNNSVFDGRVAYITSRYNTGWHCGKAVLSIFNDNQEGVLSSSNIWTDGSPSGTYSGSVTKNSYQSASADGTGSNSSQYFIGVLSSLPNFSRKSLAVTFTVTNYVAGGVRPRINSSAGIGDYANGNGTYTQVIYNNSSSNGSLQMQFNGGANLTVTVDNVHIAEDNKTPKGKSGGSTGVKVYGSPRKEQVMNGTDLTAIADFSQSNYFKQPYTSHLDFGTGDFTFMTWVKKHTLTDFSCIVHRGDGGSGTWGSGKILQCEFNTVELAFFVSESGFATYDKASVPIQMFTANKWHHYAAVRKDGYLTAYLDGVPIQTVTSTRDVSNTSADLWIGNRPNMARPAYDTSLALYRFSGQDAPGNDEIKEIFLSEKMMFRPNAKSILNRVNTVGEALANNETDSATREVDAVCYDRSTDTAHFATEYAINSYQGLVRVNTIVLGENNSDISAGGGLVVGG